MARLNAANIQTTAEELAGITDPEAHRFAGNLSALVDSINDEGRLTELGATLVGGELTSALRNRLDTLRWTRDHPEILNEQIDAPIFLTGLPRSGTTFFQYLFDRNPAFRMMRCWETARPCPPAALHPETIAPRIEASRQDGLQWNAMVKNFAAMHLLDPDGPDECHFFLLQSCSAAGLPNTINVPGYFEYVLDTLAFEDAYQVHKRQLQLLQWQAPRKRWALKYPNHVLAMDAILAVYPDARFIMTHRDPVQTLASLSKLTLALRGSRTDRNDPLEIGRQMRHFVRRHIDRLMAFHNSDAGRRAVVHVDYYRLLQSPAPVFEEIYAKLGLDMTASVRAGITDWISNNPKGKRGTHSYALEEFGLDADEIAEEYSFYTSAFDIPREADALASMAQ